MWFLADLALLCGTMLHLFMTFAVVSPVDSPLKKPVGKLNHRIGAFIDRIPFAKTSGIAALIAICLAAGMGGAWHDIAMRTRFCLAIMHLITAPGFMKITHASSNLGLDRVLALETEIADMDTINWTPPSLKVMDVLMKPMESILQTEVVGLEHVPTDRACFYVMNHALLGLEMPSFVHLLYKEKGVFVRGLAHHFNWVGPQGPLMRAMGAVDGNRQNVDLLMKANESLLVYPGGGGEVMKSSRVERYTLLWKERLGFARMAIKHGYPILPCACVGTEDMLDIILDLPIGFLGTGVDVLPIAKPNSLQKVYFWFGEPIPTKQYNGEHENTDYARELRDKTKAAVEAGIKELQERQAKDPERYLVNRVGKQIRNVQFQASETLKSVLLGAKAD